jgi:hypothetical protein
LVTLHATLHARLLTTPQHTPLRIQCPGGLSAFESPRSPPTQVSILRLCHHSYLSSRLLPAGPLSTVGAYANQNYVSPMILCKLIRQNSTPLFSSAIREGREAPCLVSSLLPLPSSPSKVRQRQLWRSLLLAPRSHRVCGPRDEARRNDCRGPSKHGRACRPVKLPPRLYLQRLPQGLHAYVAQHQTNTVTQAPLNNQNLRQRCSSNRRP